VNHNRLLEFRVSPESGQAGQEFRVRTATLWLKADIRRRRPSQCRSTEIFVFKVISRLPESVTFDSQASHREKKCTGGVGAVLFPQESEGEGGAQIEIGIGKEGDAVLASVKRE
jgi:hypothetical protein